MTQAPAFVWDAYRRAQTISARPAINDTAWAADEAGDAILDMVEQGAVPPGNDALDRQLGNLLMNRAGKHRRRAAIKAAHYDPIHSGDRTPPIFDEVAARIRLRELEAMSRPSDWSLLLRVGAGAGNGEIAVALGSTETAVKKRVARARARIAA